MSIDQKLSDAFYFEPGDYTLYGVEYIGLDGKPHVTLAIDPDSGQSTKTRAAIDLAMLRENRGIKGTIVSKRVAVTGWHAA